MPPTYCNSKQNGVIFIAKLVVAEKPSVAMSYAKVLGATSRQDGYLEGNGYLVSWCVGHLVELAPPNMYDAKYVKWSIADLPILPEKWQYLVSASTKKQFGILQKLMHRPDVESVICATDAGREGELIFRLVYQQAGCKKPFSRLWLSSMEETAIREGFQKLKPSTEYDALYNAALCRERADWMVGINASRLFSCLYGQPLAVGRVMTPVLAMTVVREAAIAAFVPEKFYTVALTLADGGTASSKRFAQKADAELLLSKCRKEGHVTVQKMERKEKSESPPQLYDLTALQRDANRLLGFTAQQTLDYALMKSKIIGVCPNCCKPVVEREKGWFCENRECRFVLWKDNAFFKRLGKRLDAHVADKLLRDGRVRLKDCKSAKGKTYNATVLLGTEADGRSKFSLEFEGGC